MGKGLAISGLVLGIVGIVLSFLGAVGAILGLPVSIVGLILSVNGGKKLKANGLPSGMATAGLVLGIIAVALTGIMFFACGICVLALGTATAI